MLNEKDLEILADRLSNGDYRYSGRGNPELHAVYRKINEIFLSKWSYIPEGGKDRNLVLKNYGYRPKRDFRPKNTLFDTYKKDKAHCKWCEFLGLDPIHSLSDINFEAGRAESYGACKYLSRYRNFLRTTEELSTAQGGRFKENVLRLFRERHLNETILTNNKLDEKCLEKFGEKCFRCGSTENIAIDHILPLHRFFAKILRNIIPLCNVCNSSKQHKWPSEFYTESELIRLAKVSGYSLSKLKNPTYNYHFIDWFLDNEDLVYDYTFSNRKNSEVYWESLVNDIDLALTERKSELRFV